MNDFWNILAQITKNIADFMLWFLNDTPLYNETLDSFAEFCTKTWQIAVPLLGDYIHYLSEYFGGAL